MTMGILERHRLPEKETAGLVLELNVSKIDDNGFVTMDVNPSVIFRFLRQYDRSLGCSNFQSQ